MKITFRELRANYKKTFIHIHKESATWFDNKNRNFVVGFEGHNRFVLKIHKEVFLKQRRNMTIHN